MAHPCRSTLSVLAVILAGAAFPLAGTPTGPLPPVLTSARLAQLRLQEPLRATQAERYLQEHLPGLGLSASDTVKLDRRFTGPQGQLVARFHQRHQGFRVFGTGVVIQVPEASGTPSVQSTALESVGFDLAGLRLDEAEALRLSHRELAPRGAYAAQPTVERLLFPTRFTGGLKVQWQGTSGPGWDRSASVLAPRPRTSHVWAYEVTSHLRNEQDGIRDMHLIVDARTGDILLKWDQAPSYLPKGSTRAAKTYGSFQRPLQVESVTPSLRLASPLAAAPVAASGTGLSQYSGEVPLSTSQRDPGGFDLWDVTRGPNPHPFFGHTGIVTAFWDATYTYWSDTFQNIVPYTMDMGTGSTTNLWGDGQPYQAPPPDIVDGNFYMPMAGYHYEDANGQTAAVDAHHATAVTYDMYRKVLGRAGLDGQDTGMLSCVHYRFWVDNAFWDGFYKMMVFGDGYFPYWPGEDRSLTSLDIAAHEMSHGVMNATADLIYAGESGGLNEANSDIMSQAVVAYARRKSTDPEDAIPAVTLDWTLGEQINPDRGPLRYMKRPSLDGTSPDAWFWGVKLLDVHYNSGIANRMFFSLSEGLPAQGSSSTASPYLPQGMSGIGLDAATRIWYKAVTEQFQSTTDYAGARAGCIQAATDLYGASSAQVAAVENAFAAVNVGPAHGKAPRPLVTFAMDLLDETSPMAGAFDGIFMEAPVVPSGEVLRLRARVANTTNQAVTWKAGIAKGFFHPYEGDPLDENGTCGSFDAEGRYHAPRTAPSWAGVRAFSAEDPLEFGACMVHTVHIDANGDGEQDAVDAGILALTWSLPMRAIVGIAAFPDPEGAGFVDDTSLQLWREAFLNAFVR